MDEKVALKDSEITIVNAVRKSRAKSKSELADYLNMPWSSLSNLIQSLMDKGVVTKTEESFQLVESYAYFVGVSFGSSRIKIVILDFNFEPIKADPDLINDDIKEKCQTLYDAFQKIEEPLMKICINQTCNSLNDFYDILNEIVEFIYQVKKKINVVSVCIVLPGEIDYEKQFIKNSYIMPKYQNIGIDKFLTKNNITKLNDCNIKYLIDHNVKASIIAEREKNNAWSNCTDEHNFMCLYLGYGIGASYIVNGQLYRGNNNESGQLGHVQIIPRDLHGNIITPPHNRVDICRCGRLNCLEHRIRTDVFGSELSDEKGKSVMVDLKNDDINKIKECLINNPNQRKLFAIYIGESLCNVILNLSIKRIVLSGKLSSLFPIIENDLNSYLIENNLSDVILEQSDLGEYSAAMGAAIDSYMNYFDTSFNW